MTEDVDRLTPRAFLADMAELLELRNHAMVIDEVGVFGDLFPAGHKFEANRIIYAQIREQLAEDSSSFKAEPTPEAAAQIAKELREKYDEIFEAANNGEMPAPHIWSELVRAQEGAESRDKGGAPKRSIASPLPLGKSLSTAQEYDVTATMRACRALTWDGMQKKAIVHDIAEWFGVSHSTVYAKTRANQLRGKDIRTSQPAEVLKSPPRLTDEPLGHFVAP